MKRYLLKKAEAQQAGIVPEELVEDYFNPEYCEVDRIISGKDTEVDGKKQRFYLVKWKNLPHTEATWEKPEDFKDDKAIMAFFKYNQRPTRENRLTADEIRRSKRWQRIDKSPGFKEGNQLRPYQFEGLNWLVFSWFEARGSILADEMGLGKTVQTITVEC